jgi:hypothetical protein
MSSFIRKRCNTICKFLVLEGGDQLLNEDGEGDPEFNINMIEKWKNSKHFLSNYDGGLNKFILIAILDEKKVIIDIEKYNEFEEDMGFEPNKFLDEKYSINLSDEDSGYHTCERNSENSNLMSSLMSGYETDSYTGCNTLFIFAKLNNTLFNYNYLLKYNTIIYEILNAIHHEFLSERVPSHCALTGDIERYNNCVFLKFED